MKCNQQIDFLTEKKTFPEDDGKWPSIIVPFSILQSYIVLFAQSMHTLDGIFNLFSIFFLLVKYLSNGTRQRKSNGYVHSNSWNGIQEKPHIHWMNTNDTNQSIYKMSQYRFECDRFCVHRHRYANMMRYAYRLNRLFLFQNGYYSNYMISDSILWICKRAIP